MKKLATKSMVSRGNLKSIADIVADTLNAGDLALFHAYSAGMFPLSFPKDLKDQAVIVGALLPGKARQAERTDAVADLKDMLPNILAGALRLADYIGAAYPDIEHERRLEQCGYTTYYTAASRGNWESVQKMGEAMKLFMVDQLAALTKGNIMPAEFPGDLNKLFEDFVVEYEKLKKAKIGLAPATNANIEQMNILEAMLAKVFKSAQAIFRNDPIKRSFYTMNNFARTLRPGTTGAIRSRLFDAVTQLPIVGARISMPYHNFETVSDKKGGFIVKDLKEGQYPLKIEANGYALVELTNIKVKTGIKTTLKPIAMTAVAADAEIPNVSPESKTGSSSMLVQPSGHTRFEPSANIDMSSPEIEKIEALPLASVESGQTVGAGDLALSENGVH